MSGAPGMKEILLGRDNISVFQDFEGRPSRKYGVKWSDAPISMVFSFPYLIAVLPKSVEVHLIETQNAVQTISLRANTITPSPHDDAAFVLANNQIYRLRPVPIHRQLDMLMEAKNFETAVRCRPHPGPRAIDEWARTQKYTKGDELTQTCLHAQTLVSIDWRRPSSQPLGHTDDSTQGHSPMWMFCFQLTVSNHCSQVRLCEMCGTSAQVAAKAGAIYKAHGMKLFMDKEFDQAMTLLSQSNTLDPREIISMFPDLRPAGYPAPEGVLALQGHQLLRAQVLHCTTVQLHFCF